MIQRISRFVLIWGLMLSSCGNLSAVPNMLAPHSFVVLPALENSLMETLFNLRKLRRFVCGALESKKSEIEQELILLSQGVPQNGTQYLLARAELAWWIYQGKSLSPVAQNLQPVALECLKKYLSQTNKNFWEKFLFEPLQVKVTWDQALASNSHLTSQVEKFLLSNEVVLKTLLLTHKSKWEDWGKAKEEIRELIEKYHRTVELKIYLFSREQEKFTLLAEVVDDKTKEASHLFLIQADTGQSAISSSSLMMQAASDEDFTAVAEFDPFSRMMTTSIDEGNSFEKCVEKQASQSERDTFRIHAVASVIQGYVRLFTRLGQEMLIPEKPSLAEIHLISEPSKSSSKNKNEIRVVFSENLSMVALPPPANFKERARQISRFVLQLYEIALKQNVKPQFFLSLLLDQATAVEKTSILISLITGLEEMPASQAQAGEESLLPQAYQELSQLLESQIKVFTSIPVHWPEGEVEGRLKHLEQIFSTIPPSINSLMDKKIGTLLLELFEAPHSRVKVLSRQWFALRFEISKTAFPQAPANSLVESCI